VQASPLRSALIPDGADIIDISCTAAFGASTVAGLSRDDFTRHFSRGALASVHGGSLGKSPQVRIG